MAMGAMGEMRRSHGCVWGQNRAVAQLALKLQVSPAAVKNVIIWGNHSSTQYPDVTVRAAGREQGMGLLCRRADWPGGCDGRCRQHATVDGQSVVAAVHDEAWLRGAFIKTVQTRGAAVIKARKLSSALSAAKAIGDHLRVWCARRPAGCFLFPSFYFIFSPCPG